MMFGGLVLRAGSSSPQFGFTPNCQHLIRKTNHTFPMCQTSLRTLVRQLGGFPLLRKDPQIIHY